MDTKNTIAVANTVAGETVVVNNKKDGVKKYSLFFGSLILGAVIQGIQQLWPNMTPFLHLLLEGIQYLGFAGGTLALTSPFDKRGVVLNTDGSVTGTKLNGPVPPTGPGGFGLSMFIAVLALPVMLFGLTGCSFWAGADGPAAGAIPQSCPTVYKQPVPLMPVATASRVQPVSNVTTVGLDNPGAFPGEIFSSTQGISCQKRMTTDGWITVCAQPNDGDNFDIRNQMLGAPVPLQTRTVVAPEPSISIGARIGTPATVVTTTPGPVAAVPPAAVVNRNTAAEIAAAEARATYPGLLTK